MKRKTEQLQQHIGYRFQNSALIERALTHRSANSKHNERLEFLGDAVLGLVVAAELFERFPKATEGQLSRLRASLVKGATLAALAKKFDLGELLALGSGELKSGGFRRDSILAGALEAVFGAVYLDGGMDAARKVILGLLREKIDDTSPDLVTKDPKTQLQEHLQGQRRSLPVYTLLETVGEAHKQTFKVSCEVEGLSKLTTGKGGSRRAAEQEAASKALLMLTEANEKQ